MDCAMCASMIDGVNGDIEKAILSMRILRFTMTGVDELKLTCVRRLVGSLTAILVMCVLELYCVIDILSIVKDQTFDQKF